MPEKSEANLFPYDGMCTCTKASVDIFPAPDVPEALLVYCPRMDIMTQVMISDGEDEAFEAIKDACGLVIDHNAREMILKHLEKK